jgi:hypothetical protein
MGMEDMLAAICDRIDYARADHHTVMSNINTPNKKA